VLEAASKRRRSGRRSQCHDVCLLVCELDHDRSLGPNPTCPAPLDATSPFLFFVTFTILWAEFHLRRLIQHSFFHSFHHSDPDLCRLVTSNAHTTTRSPPSQRSPSRSRLANTTQTPHHTATHHRPYCADLCFSRILPLADLFYFILGLLLTWFTLVSTRLDYICQ
jgi:hypothetical protein